MDALNTFVPIIVASLSFVVSIYTLYISRKKIANEIKAKFVDQVMRKRIETYPELWGVVGLIYRKSLNESHEQFDREWAVKCHSMLIDWYYTRGNGVFLNLDSKEAFFKYEEALMNYGGVDDRAQLKYLNRKLKFELRADLKLERRRREDFDI